MISSRVVPVLAALAIAAAGCGPASPSPSAITAAPTATPEATPTPAHTATAPATSTAAPTPTPPEPALSLADLEGSDFEPTRATAVCEPTPAQADPDAGEATIDCSEALAWTVAATRTVTDAEVTRLFVDRPECAATPCTDAELNTVTGFAWVGDQVLGLTIDRAAETATVPAPVDGAPWPASGGSAVPGVRRAALDDAPTVVVKREAVPFCGRAELGEPESVQGCFRDSVLDGRSAEMIDIVFTHDGVRVVRLFRFEGDGPIVMFQRTGRDWLRVDGTMILGITPRAWDFDPWSNTQPL